MFGGLLPRKETISLVFLFSSCAQKWFAVWVCLAFVGRYWCTWLDFFSISVWRHKDKLGQHFYQDIDHRKCLIVAHSHGVWILPERRHLNLLPPTVQTFPLKQHSALSLREITSVHFIWSSWCCRWRSYWTLCLFSSASWMLQSTGGWKKKPRILFLGFKRLTSENLI